MGHNYSDPSRNYTIKVVAHGNDGGTTEAHATVSLRAFAARSAAVAGFDRFEMLLKAGQYESGCAEFERAFKTAPIANPQGYYRYVAALAYLRRGDAAGSAAERFFTKYGWGTNNADAGLAPWLSLVGYAGYRQAGMVSDAKRLIEEAAAKCNATRWPYAVISYLHGDIDGSALVSLVGNNFDCLVTVRTYAGIKRLYDQDDVAAALGDFAWVAGTKRSQFVEYPLCISELRHFSNPQLSGQALIPTSADMTRAQAGFDRAEFFWRSNNFAKFIDEFYKAYALFPVPPQDTLYKEIYACDNEAQWEAAGRNADLYLGMAGWKTDASAYAVAFGCMGYRRAKDEAAFKSLIEKGFGRCNPSRWPYPIVAYLHGDIDEGALEAMVARDANRSADVKTIVGLNNIAKGNPSAGLALLADVARSAPHNNWSYPLAVLELRRSGLGAQ